MKERPILFSGEMVRAILDGRKTQTRRVIKPQPWNEADRTAGGCGFAWGRKGYDSRALYWNTTEQSLARSMIGECPYGQPGDRLWVRETFCESPDGLVYRATEQESGSHQPDDYCIWSPSIHMPLWASRITLEIESVRVQRVQSITEDDARQEGSFLNRCDCSDVPESVIGFKFNQTGCRTHGIEFKVLWDDINAKRGFGWELNPWVWVITFRMVK